MKDYSEVYGLCKQKGKLTFAEMQRLVSRASWVERAVSGAKGRREI